jgi:hypothetical protein
MAAASLLAQSRNGLEVSRKIHLKAEIEDVVAYGLVKEMACDAAGNIFAPAMRKYTEATDSVVRIRPDGQSYLRFSLGQARQLRGGDITDFAVEPNGEVFVLARQVLKYADLEVPQEFGNTFLIHYDRDGKVIGQLRLAVDTNDFEPTGFAVLQDGETLVVGRAHASTRLRVLAQVFRGDGGLKSRLNLGGEGSEASKTGRIASTRVVRPKAIRVGNSIYVLRGTTGEPVYALSDAGELLRSIPLKGPDIEFSAPLVQGNELIVHKHLPAPEDLSSQEPRSEYAVFDLQTGSLVRTLSWNQAGVGLACSSLGKMVFMGQDQTPGGEGWVIFQADSVPRVKL